MSSRTYSVVIADDDASIRESLGELLNHHPSLTVVGVADNGATAAQLCGASHADLVVLDVMMPTGGTAAIEAVRFSSPETVIACYTAASDRRTRQRLLTSGAQAVFGKGAAIDLASALYDLVNRSDEAGLPIGG